MNGEEVVRDEVRRWLGNRPPATAEALLGVITGSMKAASADEARRMVEAMAGFLGALAEGNKKENEHADGNRG